jgi:hypothetical protein
MDLDILFLLGALDGSPPRNRFDARGTAPVSPRSPRAAQSTKSRRDRAGSETVPARAHLIA